MDESGSYVLGVAMLISWLASLAVGWGTASERSFQTVPSSCSIVFSFTGLLRCAQTFLLPLGRLH